MRQRLKTILAVLYQRLPLWCYLAALALWLGLALADYIGDGLRDRFRAGVKRRHFAHAHRAVPNHGFCAAYNISIQLRRFRADVETFKTVRHFTGLDDLLVAIAAESVTAVCVHGQNEFVAALSHQFLGQFDFVRFN